MEIIEPSFFTSDEPVTSDESIRFSMSLSSALFWAFSASSFSFFSRSRSALDFTIGVFDLELTFSKAGLLSRIFLSPHLEILLHLRE